MLTKDFFTKDKKIRAWERKKRQIKKKKIDTTYIELRSMKSSQKETIESVNKTLKAQTIVFGQLVPPAAP